jgi:acetyltransferase
VISPYPRKFERTVELGDGREVLLRPIRPEDEPLEAEMFRNFSLQTQRFRFFGPIGRITHEMLIRYTQIDYDREMAIIAVIDEPDGQKMAGVVRIIGDAYNDSAEFAIVVADPWQGRGLGGIFTDYILQVAMEMGFRRIYANFVHDNFIMKHLFESRGFTIKRGEDMYTAELTLA